MKARGTGLRTLFTLLGVLSGCAAAPSDQTNDEVIENVEEQSVEDSQLSRLNLVSFPRGSVPYQHFESSVVRFRVDDSSAAFQPRETVVMRVNFKDDAKALNGRIAPVTVELYRVEGGSNRRIARQLLLNDARTNSFTQFSTKLSVFATRFIGDDGKAIGDFEFTFATERSSDYPDYIHMIGTGRGLFSLARGEYAIVLRRQYEPETGKEEALTTVLFENVPCC